MGASGSRLKVVLAFDPFILRIFYVLMFVFVFILFQAANLGLSDVDLSWNHIREKGAVAIVKALHVSLPSNNIELTLSVLITTIVLQMNVNH